jgi:enoyl-[acyl-carrier-protein] reductase (NADH)
LDSKTDYGYDYYTETEPESAIDFHGINKVLDHLNTMADVAKASLSSLTGFLESIKVGVKQLKVMTMPSGDKGK